MRCRDSSAVTLVTENMEEELLQTVPVDPELYQALSWLKHKSQYVGAERSLQPVSAFSALRESAQPSAHAAFSETDVLFQLTSECSSSTF